MGANVDVFVCVTCAADARWTKESPHPGAGFADALSARLADIKAENITVRQVECLAVCKRPHTVALAADGKWTYIIGDLKAEDHLEDIANAAVAFQQSENGLVPWKERPLCFRQGVISRTPPLGFEHPATEPA